MASTGNLKLSSLLRFEKVKKSIPNEYVFCVAFSPIKSNDTPMLSVRKSLFRNLVTPFFASIILASKGTYSRFEEKKYKLSFLMLRSLDKIT